MNDVINGLEPKEVFRYFQEISAIPHGSRNTKQISDYCVRFAKERNLQYIQDDLNNVIIIKEASPGRETSEGVILQGHLDMVAEKKSSSGIDLQKDGLRLMREGDFLYAEDTTLGGDDGIAIAYVLAVLDSTVISHPRLEAVFTVDEEIGMLGAAHIDISMLKGKYLLNIDSEEEGILLSGCAGGMTSVCILPISYAKRKGRVYKITVSGLKGGHSGMEIDKERGNANILLGRVLYKLKESVEYNLEGIQGGFKDNAIPREASASILIEETKSIEELIRYMGTVFQKEYAISDEKIKILLEEGEEGEFEVITPEDRDKIIFFLMNCPNGILNRSQSQPSLIETSLNLGILNIYNQEIRFSFSVRSAVKERKQALGERLESLITYLGGVYEVNGIYPEWEYNPDSYLLTLMSRIYREMFSKECEIQTIHAGLECGYFKEKSPQLDIVSFGPDIYDIHTTEERMSISSVLRMYQYLIEILQQL